MLDKPVLDDFKPEPLGKPGDNVFAERAHFARHCYNGHGDLLRINSLRPFARAIKLRKIAPRHMEHAY
jgi:hypothetical protein